MIYRVSKQILAKNSILCSFFFTMYVIETWENFFYIPKWIADHHFFSIQFFFVRTANIMRLKKGFFSNWYEHQSSARREWACVQLWRPRSDEILHVNITNFSRKLLNFCIIEWRWWVDKLDSSADSVSNIKKIFRSTEFWNWMIFYLQYIWQLNKHHDLTSIFFLEKKNLYEFSM